MKSLSVFILTALAVAGSAICLAAESPREYKLKAAFLYNFLLFTEWPEDAPLQSKDSITIGILGSDPFGDAFDPIEGEAIRGKKLLIKRFESGTPTEPLRQCDLLFISSSLRGRVEGLLKSLEGQPVLTVSEVEGFVESGGMINLVKKANEIKFEINRAAAERAGIKFRSKLLRLAVRIIEDSNGERDAEQD